jgi:hypothetical protein
MTRSRIIWFSLTALVVVFFLAGIPIDAYEKHEMLYSFLGGFLFFACLFMGLGDFESIYDITETTAEHTDDRLRKLSPFAVIPAFVMVFVFVMSHSSRVSAEVKEYGVLTKALVTGGQSSSSSRRGRTTTTYDVYVSYTDSLKREYTAELDVSGSEFKDLYEGAVIDIIYSSKHPSLAKPVLSLGEMSKYKKIAMGDVGVEHMIAILEEKVKPDSVKGYLNTICYEWREEEGGDYFINDQKKIAIAVALEQGKVLYIRETMALAYDQERLFEKSAEAYGFKKREMNDGEKTVTEYYTDQYVITKERKSVDGQDSGDILNKKALEIYSVIRTQ